MRDIHDLLDDVSAGGRRADEAAADLALLIRWKVRDITDGLDLDDLPLPLTDAELEDVTTGLLRAVDTADPPRGAVVWALGETLDPRVVPPLTEIVERFAEPKDADEAHLVYNALGVLDTFGSLDAEALRALATRQDDLGELARGLLNARFH